MKRPKEADHAVYAEGLQPGRARYVRALMVLPQDWEPRSGVPASRAACPVTRPCPFVRCSWNLWMVDGRDRPGGHRGRIPSVVVAHVHQNCGADVADGVHAGRIDASDIGDHVGLSDRQVRRIVEKAHKKLEAIPEAAHLLELMDECEQREDSIMAGKVKR